MFTERSSILSSTTTHYHIEHEGKVLSVAEVIRYWIDDADFRSFYNRLLATSPFPAYFWELPPMTAAGTGVPFEFVLVNSHSLARVQADDRPFRSHFGGPDPVAVFSNIGGDATLVVPTPMASKNIYPHLAQFVRSAPEEQLDQFWQTVGRTYQQKLTGHKLWLSTSGLGVYWLHIRLDSRPKYYTYAPYRR